MPNELPLKVPGSAVSSSTWNVQQMPNSAETLEEILEKRRLWAAHSACLFSSLLVERIAAFVQIVNLRYVSKSSFHILSYPCLFSTFVFLVVRFL
jgi:hypothetical protein